MFRHSSAPARSAHPGRSLAREIVLATCALASLTFATRALAIDTTLASTPLVEKWLLHAQRPAGTPAASPSAQPATTRSSALRTTVAGPPSARSFVLTSPQSSSAPGAVGSGKLPGTLGIAGDLYGWSFSTCGDMFGDGVSDAAVGAPNAIGPKGAAGEVVIYYGVPGLLPPPSYLYGEAPGDEFGYSVAGVGDVNGDGYPDLLVGAPFRTIGGQALAGEAYLFLGSAAGFVSPAAWTFSMAVPQAAAEVGYSVAWAGDVNNDGYDDWMVGAPGYSNGESSEGAAFLFLGGPGALSTTPAWSYESNVAAAQFGYCVSTAGDVNADGFADILVAADNQTDSYSQEGKVYLFLGASPKPSLVAARTWTGGQAGAFLGTSVAPAGDVNGDGYADFIMGAPGFDDAYADQGEALIALGGPSPLLFAPPQTLEGPSANARFGASVATAGDMNGDGYADVIIGATGISYSGFQGKAFLYLGWQYGIIGLAYNTIQTTTTGQIVGISVGTLGDYLGTGYPECGAGAPGGGPGQVFGLIGGPVPVGTNEIIAAQGYNPGLEHGYSTAAADVNGDGYDDLIVGSYHEGYNAPYDGVVSVYEGGPNAFPPAGPYPFVGAAPNWQFEGEADDYLGISLTNAGDVNGDGYQDFIAGAPFHSNPESGEGEAVLFYGSPGGPQGGAPWVVEGNQIGALAGWGVGGGGDLNGDGYDDVAVGMPQGDVGTTYEGLVKVYYGSSFGLSHDPAIVLHGGQASAFMGTTCTIVGDVNGDGYDDLVVGAEGASDGEANEGLAYVYFGSPTGIHATPDQTLQINVANAAFGWAAYRLGDVNGDGYADVAIDAPYVSDPETDEGELFVFLGSAGGLQQPAVWSLEGDQVNDSLGQSGISGADVNGDGYDDVVVGEPYSAYLATDGGRVRVYPGGPSGPDVSTILDESSGNASDRYGFATTGHADFDGDGFSDLVATSPGLGLVGPQEGGAYVRFGNSAWVAVWNPARPLSARRADDSAPIAPGLRSDSQTSFRLKGLGKSAAGRTRLRLESEVKPLAVPFDFNGHAKASWQSTGPVAAGLGSTAPVNVALGGLTAATNYRWRARYQTRSVLFPFTPWLGSAERARTERHLATAGAPLAVGVDPAPGGAPGAVALAPAAPNPSAGGTTSLAFTLPRAGDARLALYDLRGRLVRALFEGSAAAGRTTVAWDGLDGDGRKAPAGAYFARLTALGKEVTEKLVRLP